MSRQHKDLGSGPPRGPGHYSEDGRRWWDDDHRRWFTVIDQEDQLEVEVENFAETSLFNRLWSGLFAYWGSPSYFRFVGRARSADPRWPTYQVVGATFPETCLDDPSKEPWVNEQRASLEELHQQLLRGGMAADRAGRALVVAALQAAGGEPDRHRAGEARHPDDLITSWRT